MGGVLSNDRELRAAHARHIESENRRRQRLIEEVTGLKEQREELERNAKVALALGGVAVCASVATIYALSRRRLKLERHSIRQMYAKQIETLQKRSAVDVKKARQQGKVRFAKDLLDVADNLERASDIEKTDTSKEALLEGVSMTKMQLQKTFTKHGIVKINPLGSEFNPDCHEAVGRSTIDEVENAEHNEVTSVVQVGYSCDEQVIRPARVFVMLKNDSE